jgi:5'-nucleotidase
MPFPIEHKLVVAVASSALFDLRESHAIYLGQGTEVYRKYQRENENRILSPGVAFPFIRRLLNLNSPDDLNDQPVEVILLSRNDPDTGLRVFKSIQHYSLNISRGAFLSGTPPYRYINAFNASLFLSASQSDVEEAVRNGYPAGRVLGIEYIDDQNDDELRVAFDFDGVLADDEAERIYQERRLEGFHEAERQRAQFPLNPGPLKDLFNKIVAIQRRRLQTNSDSGRTGIRTAIITARNAPAHERVVTTLRDWDIKVDETFFLGGMDKNRILEVFRPHIFFDDQLTHAEPATGVTPSVHVPFGVVNQNRMAAAAESASSSGSPPAPE